MKGRLDVCINDDRVYELLLMTTDGTSPDRAEVRDVFASFSLFTIDPKARPAAPATEGERFIAKEGGFSVILPTGSTQPEVNSQSVPSIGADAKLYRYTADNAEGTYMLITSPLPMEPVTEADRADLIARILENQLRSLNAAPGTEATVSSQRDTTLGGIAHHIVILSTE